MSLTLLLRDANGIPMERRLLWSHTRVAPIGRAPGDYKLMQSNEGTRTQEADQQFKDLAEAGSGT